MENYSNLDAWVSALNERIDAVFVERLGHAIDEWCTEFLRTDEDVTDGESPKSSSSVSIVIYLGCTGLTSQIQIKPLVHEIRIRNQVIYLDPPIELARQEWLGQFQTALGIVCNLNRIRSSRYEISLQVQEEGPENLTYLSLVSKSVNNIELQLIAAFVACGWCSRETTGTHRGQSASD